MTLTPNMQTITVTATPRDSVLVYTDGPTHVVVRHYYVERCEGTVGRFDVSTSDPIGRWHDARGVSVYGVRDFTELHHGRVAARRIHTAILCAQTMTDAFIDHKNA